MKRIQTIISVFFATLLTISFIISTTSLMTKGENPFLFPNIFLLILALIFSLLIINKPIFRYMQAFTMMIISFSLLYINDGFDRIWGWGLFSTSFLLMIYYEFFDKKRNVKATIFGLCFLVSIFFFLSVTTQNVKWEKLLTSLVYMIGNGSIWYVLHKSKIKELDNKRKKLDLEIELIQQEKEALQNEWITLKAEIEAEKESYKEKEVNLRLREVDLINSEQIFRNSVKDLCLVHQFDEISTAIIEIFFNSRGSATNKFIASEIGIAEQTVKNKLFAIYKKLDISSRSQLISKLDSIVAKSLYKS